MKLSKNLGRIATTFLATAMLASVAAVPAFAAAGDPGITTDPTDNKFVIQKTVDVKENSYAPAVTVNFTVAPAESLTQVERSSGIELGVTGGVTQESGATISQGTVLGADGTGNATFQVNLVDAEGEAIFNHAGVYKYTVTETAGQSYAGMTYTSEVKTLYVYITNGDNGALEVAYTELVDSDGTSKTNNFTNYYGTDEEEDLLHDLTVKKVIRGNSANLSGTFTFTITIAGDEDIEADEEAGIEAVPEKFYYVVYDSDDQPKAGGTNTATSDDAFTVTLGNGEYVVVYGLSAGDQYTVIEDKAGEEGYVTSVTTGTTATNGTNTPWDKDEEEKDIVGQVSANSFENDAYVTYTNTKDASAPTGIAMDIAPYALLVVIAAAGCFVFLRKRNED